MPLLNRPMAQLTKQTGLGRPGGAASRGSTPSVATPGRGFAAMENAMMKTLKPNVKKLAPTKGRQVKKAAAENFGQGQNG